MSLAYLRARYPHVEAMLQHSAAVFGPPSNSNSSNAMNAAEAINALDHTNSKPQPLAHMTYQSLTEALARLADDPRIHPSTRIELEVEHEIAYYDNDSHVSNETSHTAEPLVSISLTGGILRLSATAAEPALAR